MLNNIRKNYENAANILRIISHPVRLAILDILLTTEEECVCHMEAILGVRQAYLSQHLMGLREAGIVVDRRDGRNIFYRINNKDLSILIGVTKSLANQETGLINYKAFGCDCPKCIKQIRVE